VATVLRLSGIRLARSVALMMASMNYSGNRTTGRLSGCTPSAFASGAVNILVNRGLRLGPQGPSIFPHRYSLDCGKPPHTHKANTSRGLSGESVAREIIARLES
jgi:hypothetical protein